ncbi:MAG: hypothetical protein WBG17_11630 [Burkholderiaceae bacterium]
MERVSSLEQALAQLSSAGELASDVKTNGKAAGHAGKTAKAREPKRRRAVREEAGQAGELPSTAGDYWQNLIDEQPKSGAEILAAAIEALGFVPTRAQVGKLRNRMAFALKALVQSGAVKDSGSGRARRYFRA